MAGEAPLAMWYNQPNKETSRNHLQGQDTLIRQIVFLELASVSLSMVLSFLCTLNPLPSVEVVTTTSNELNVTRVG